MKKLILNNELIKNMALNIIANVVPICFLQLVLLPFLSRFLDSEEYGLMVTIIAVLNVVPSTLGNTLNNIRLLHNKKYIENNCNGDFNIMLLMGSLINIIILIFYSVFCLKVEYSGRNLITHILLIILLSIFWIIREYFIVAFLIDVRYDKILVNNIILTLGYLVGYCLFQMTLLWEVVYIAGYLLSDLHLLKDTMLWKEPLKITKLFYTTCKEYVLFVIACIIARLITYADKLLLFPILGGTVVSIYYVATLSSKVILLLISPISNVILNYLSKSDRTSIKSFVKMLKLGTIICVLGYCFSMFITEPVLKIIYPDYVEMAMKYVYLTTLTAMIRVLIGLINPYILCFLSMKWQMLINLITLFMYIFISLILLKKWGLYGFCIGGVITNLFKMLVMISLFIFQKHKECKV